MSDPHSSTDNLDPPPLVESSTESPIDRPAVDPTHQIRFLQILADKVAESLRNSSELRPPASDNTLANAGATVTSAAARLTGDRPRAVAHPV